MRARFRRLQRRHAAIPDLLGLPVGLGLCEAAARHRLRRRWKRSCRPGKSATSRTRTTATSRFNPGDGAGLALRQCRSDVHLGKAQDAAMTPGNDRRTITTFAIIALADPRHGGRQLHQPRHRPRQPARPRSCAAQGARCQPPAADHPVRRRIDPDLAVSMLIALALVELLVQPFAAFLDADLALNYFGSGGILLPVDRPGAAGRRRSAGSIRPSSCRASSRRRSSRPISRPRKRRVRPAAHGAGRRQFAVSIGLIICTAVIYGQTVYARSSTPATSATTSFRSTS